VLISPSLRVPIVALALLWLDLLLMPLCAPVLSLKPFWVVGEIVAIMSALVPSLYLARWTANGQHVGHRAALQAAAFSGLMLLVVPEAIFAQTGGSWHPLLDHPGWWTNLVVQLLAVPAVLGLSAVHEFASRGDGTPVPLDPPERLVASGPYAYVANPMQLAMCLVLIGWAALLENWLIAAGSIIALAYGAGFAAWHEDAELALRFGSAWTAYRNRVPRWFPRWRPAVAEPSRLYVAESCGLCSDVGLWLKKRGPIGLDIVAAEKYDAKEILRMTYAPAGGGAEDDGVAAFARALEHVNFAWAWVGMLMRLPLVRPALQFLVDASGGYARPLQRPVSGNLDDIGACDLVVPRLTLGVLQNPQPAEPEHCE
jgi:protein-S-isoprenylcysteine O-methyltransferase Ste14